MGVWEFVVVYLAIFVLLQFVVYRYLRGRDDGAPAAWGSTPNAEAGPYREGTAEREGAIEGPAGRDGDDGDGEGRRCPHCGASNAVEQTFTFCRNCAGSLRG